MDSFTHALCISTAFILAGRPELAPLGILGAIIPDIDVLFRRFSDCSARLYIFIHGGFTHSIFGALVTALITYLAAVAITVNIPFLSPLRVEFGIMPLVITAAGALSHVLLDILAFPGIPLLYPISDRKYTLGIFTGPSVLMLLASIIFIELLVFGKAGVQDFPMYAAVFLAVLAYRSGLKLNAALQLEGIAIPTANPLRWLVIDERADAYAVYRYHLILGISEEALFEKYYGITSDEVAQYRDLPEVRRHRYNSYVTTVEKDGDTLVFRDPVREQGYLWYPAHYMSLRIVNGSAVP